MKTRHARQIRLGILAAHQAHAWYLTPLTSFGDRIAEVAIGYSSLTRRAFLRTLARETDRLRP